MTRASSHFLVVTDDPARGERLIRPFGDWGWDAVVVAGEATAALQRLVEGPFDVVLLDLEAAERDDHAFLRRRQADERTAAVPVVIIASLRVTLERLARCVELGAGDYITHPNSHVLLRARLQNVLQRKLLEEQARTALEAFNEIEKIADDLRLVILPIGAALSAETEYDALVARIVAEARKICDADAGALYLAQDDGMLHTIYIHIDSLGVTLQNVTGAGKPLAYLPLADPQTGEPNYDNLVAYVALTGETVNLTDIDAARFHPSGLRELGGDGSYRPQTGLAVPLRSGQVMGTLLLVNSRRPPDGEIIPFDAYHQQVAESLASQAAVVLNNRLLNERQAQLLRFKRELEIGREIQLSFLPAKLPAPAGWEVVARFRPALEVAGDFYDVFMLPHGNLALVIADVVGKGITAALFMAIIRSLFRAHFQQSYYQAEALPEGNPGRPATPLPLIDGEALVKAVRLTNAYLLTNHSEAYVFATMFAAVLDPDSGRLIYVNAGHNPPLVVRADGRGGHVIREELEPTGPAIGLLPELKFALGETRLRPGEMLFTYTDGVTEARNPQEEEFGLGRLEALLPAHGDSAEGALAAIEAAMDEFTQGAEAFDDVTMLALRWGDGG